MSTKKDSDLLKRLFGDIEFVDSKKHHHSIVLPSTFTDMERYIKHNKKELTQTIVDAIEAALKNNLACVEVFEFDKSGFVVVISESEFIENLLNALEVLQDDSVYENRINELLDILNKRETPHVKKTKKSKTSSKTTKRRKSSKRKPKKRDSDGLDSGG